MKPLSITFESSSVYVMGIWSHWILSLPVFYPLGLPLEPLGWSTGRDVAMKAGRAVGIGCRGLGRWVSRGRWLVVWMNGRGTCWFDKDIGSRGCAAIVWMWFSNKFVNLASHSFISRMSYLNSFWKFFRHWFELPIGLPYFLTLGNQFGSKYFT